MKQICILIWLTIVCSNVYSQIDSLSKDIHLSLHDYLEMRLQIRALELTVGIYAPEDMGKVGFPVTMDLNSKNKIRFRIEGKVDTLLDKKIQQEIMTESIQIVLVGIYDIISSFDNIRFDEGRSIVGFWYYPNSLLPCAGWRNNKFEWIVYRTEMIPDPFEAW